MKVMTIGCLLAAGAALAAPQADELARENAHTEGKTVIAGMGNVQISLDRADAQYSCGDEAVFTITVGETHLGEAASRRFRAEGNISCRSGGTPLPPGVPTPLPQGKVSWTLDNYGAHVFGKGTVDLAKENPFVVKGTLAYPGFLRVTVRDDRGKQLRQYSAAYEPEKIRTGVPKPADFDAFWDGAVARLEKEVPLDPQVEPVPSLSRNGLTVCRVSFATFGGRVYGALSYPTKADEGPYPVRVFCPGAGPGWTLGGCRGKKGEISLYMSVHGFPLPETDAERKAQYEKQEAKYRAIHGPNRARAYPVGGLTVSREAAHYFSVILGINRAVDWVAKRPDADLTRFTYSGASQGGGFGLYLCGLNRHFTRAYIGVPALADVLSCKVDGRQSGWPRILEYETQTDPERLARIVANAPYIDGAYFAERITIPVRLSVGYADESCAPHAVCAAYNAIPSKDKKLYHGIGGLHSSRNAPREEVNEWLEEK